MGLQALVAYAVIRFVPGWPTRGQFGDTFGVTNALFSGLALAGLIGTIVLQQEQIEDQRRDSADIRAEADADLKNQKRAALLSLLGPLIEYYDSRLTKLEGLRADGLAGANLASRKTDLIARRGELEEIIMSLHDDVVKGLGEA